MTASRPTEHQENWWGNQPCRRCNSQGILDRPTAHRPLCPDCDGSGWTEWAALAPEPWSELVPGLWLGGHDYVVLVGGLHKVVSQRPASLFDTVISLYHRPGFEPEVGVENFITLIPDGPLDDPDRKAKVVEAAALAAQRVEEDKITLVRCQAGLNRAALVCALALMELGYQAEDAIQLIRARRSPWALCNDYFVDFIKEQGTSWHNSQRSAEGESLGSKPN